MTTTKGKRNSRGGGNCHKTKHDWHDTESSRSDEMKRVTADAVSGSGEEQRGRRHAAKSAETNGQATTTALSVCPPLLYEAQREVTALFNKPGQNVCDRFPVAVFVKCRRRGSMSNSDVSLHSICSEWV